MKLNNAFRPGISLAETHFSFWRAKRVIAEAVSRVADEGFYECVEIADINDVSDRKRIGKIVRSHDLVLTQWMTSILTSENLNLCSLDAELRKKSVARIKDCFEPAIECGVRKIAVLSGPDPGPALRADARKALHTSLCELAEALKTFGSVYLLIEPLDREAHKKGLIGPTPEAVSLIRNLRQSHPLTGLSWDSSHAALCGEDILESLSICKPYIVQLHLANPVLDHDRSDFGDNHIPLGAPGFLTLQKVADLFQKAAEIGLFVGQRLCISVEIRTPENVDPWQIVTEARHSLVKAWSLYQERQQGDRGNE